MGLETGEKKTYLHVSYGKVVKRCEETTPDAVKRTKKDGEDIWELQWDSLSGVLDAISFRDDEYGKSWSVTLIDSKEVFVLQMPEDSRFGGDLMKKLPNLKHGQTYKFKPYDFERNGKRSVGLSITQGEEKIGSYYQKFTKKDDGSSWGVENLHGFPPYEGENNDKDDLKVYFIRLNKFLRTNALAYIQSAGFRDHLEPEAERESEVLPF